MMTSSVWAFKSSEIDLENCSKQQILKTNERTPHREHSFSLLIEL
jgi:hypothetical protein